ncbi:MAG: PTS sugar transporter subunit IIB [Spirochaetia bacterium]
MPDIRLVRIDNRLIHGQVGTAWLPHVQANLALVANDEVSGDEMRQSLMNMVVPTAVQTRFFSLEKTIEIIHKATDAQHIAIIVETPIDALILKKGGVPFDAINVGNMHGGDGKKPIAKSAFASEEEIQALKELVGLGVKVTYQQLPTESLIDLTSAINNA